MRTLRISDDMMIIPSMICAEHSRVFFTPSGVYAVSIEVLPPMGTAFVPILYREFPDPGDADNFARNMDRAIQSAIENAPAS